MTKVLVLLALAAKLQAQSSSMILCDQASPKHCWGMTAPTAATLSPVHTTMWGKSGALLVGLASTDLSILAGSVVSSDAFVSVSATSNASVMSMAATPSTGGADISVGKTGTGTLLPLRFWRNPNIVAQFDTSNRFLVGMTSTDLGTGLGSIVAGDTVIVATATSNASTITLGLSAGNYAALSSGKSGGSGTYLPLTFWTSNTERFRIDTSGNFIQGATTRINSTGAGTFSGVTASTISGLTQCIQANSSGVLQGTGTGCGTPPAGSTGEVQFNTSGALDSDPNNFLWEKSNHRLVIGLASSDVGAISLVTGNAIAVVTAASNASIGSFGAVAGSYVALSSSKTGSGSYLPLTFWTSGVERLRIDTSGNWFQGATQRLTSTGAATLSGVTISTIVGSTQCVQANSSGVFSGTGSVCGGAPAGSTGDIQFNTAGAFDSDTGKIFWDKTNHRLGLGTFSPSAVMEIQSGSVQHSARFGNNVSYLDIYGGNGGSAWIDVPSWDFGLRTNSTTRIFIMNTGNVGMGGNLSPSEILDVTGTINSSGGYKVGTTSIVDSSRNAVFTKVTFGGGVILQSASPQLDATGLGAAFNFNGSSTVNGNIVMNPGNIAGSSSVVVNGRNNSTLSTGNLILNELTALGASITIEHGGTFDANWQGGSSAAFDVSGNSLNHMFLVLHTGKTLVGRTSDNGTGAIFQAQGNISTSGTYIANAISGITSVVSVRNSLGSGSCSITVTGGIITASTC